MLRDHRESQILKLTSYSRRGQVAGKCSAFLPASLAIAKEMLFSYLSFTLSCMIISPAHLSHHECLSAAPIRIIIVIHITRIEDFSSNHQPRPPLPLLMSSCLVYLRGCDGGCQPSAHTLHNPKTTPGLGTSTMRNRRLSGSFWADPGSSASATSPVLKSRGWNAKPQRGVSANAQKARTLTRSMPEPSTPTPSLLYQAKAMFESGIYAEQNPRDRCCNLSPDITLSAELDATVCTIEPHPFRHSELLQLDGCDDSGPSTTRHCCPDRFMRETPTKETFLLGNNEIDTCDPFSPATSRSFRVSERFATTRSASTPAVWSVGGSAVTEGVASTTNGRGRRTTSGTSAPHHAADFLGSRSPAEETSTHTRRLAVAMDICQTNSNTSTPSSPRSPVTPSSDAPWQHARWINDRWERPVDSSPSKPKAQAPRKISTVPYKVLDAPALRDDYYCSLLAYSHTLQCLAVGLGTHVYLWSEPREAAQSRIPDSLAGPRGSSFVTSLSFSSAGGGSAILAIGRADGKVSLWSPSDASPRFDSVQPTAVSYVCFRPMTRRRRSMREANIMVETEELLVGDEGGNVYLYSVEWPNPDQRDLFDWHGSMTLLARIGCHTQQICGIAWSPDGELFATGGNDNKLFLFETKKILRRSHNRDAGNATAVDVHNGDSIDVSPNATEILAILPGQQKHTFSLNAACKAIAFAPWQPSLIAAGGGSNDRCIHFFHALSGARLATIDCYAQVTSLVFNPQKREIAATFGFAQPEHPYRVAVFAWPSCHMVVGIPWWGEERALYGIEYPGGSLVVATSDASIKFHEVWSGKDSGGVLGGLLGSPILDDELTMERTEWIR